MRSDLSRQSLAGSCYLVIEGPIGVGKTTLARMLREQLGANLLLEVFEENPFLAKFYESRARYAFQTQMFFLLSRYRQQQQVHQLIQDGALVADYMFAKDRLFAQLNLAGDEWEVYQQLHRALAEHIPPPHLVVYLKADLDVLMTRITQRDRPYERDMDEAYIEDLRQAYDHFFASYRETPVLAIDTNSLNFVAIPADFQFVMEQIRIALQEGWGQELVIQPEAVEHREDLLTKGRPLADFQRYHSQLDRQKGFITDLYFNYLRLSEELGKLGSELARLWQVEASLVLRGQAAREARQTALRAYRKGIEEELADCMAYLLRLANYAEIDLETAYLGKMDSAQAELEKPTEGRNSDSNDLGSSS